ncbi:MAG: DNA primase [Chloracidobacterium sp.]|nr:DNA primase [Chloracidobacterium sp.]
MGALSSSLLVSLPPNLHIMRIPRGFSDELRNQADIVRIVSDYVSLKKKGRDWAACCPFHNEKTPSFYVSPVKQIFKCFGCSKGGSVFDFVMEIEGCSFPEAIRVVAEKVGVTVPVETDNARQYEERESQRADLMRLNQWATEFFEQNLTETAEGRRALDYLAARGVNEDTRKGFRLGYAPNSWDAMIAYLRSRGASTTQIERSGLVSVRDSGGYYDRFRSRLMFPIRDAQGRIIAFGGRILGDGEPKYLNSPETPLYIKGMHLYGLSQARESIRQRGYAILVEGYMDFLIPFQAGVRNLVASLGTALTENQTRLLGRYARRIVVNFDPDSAGQSATKRSLELLLTESFKVNVLTLPDNLDPDEYITAHGSESYLKLLKGSQPFLDYIVDQAISSHDQKSPTGKVETINAILPYLRLVKDKIERAEHFERIADRLKIDSRLIREEFKKAAETRLERVGERAVKATLIVKPAERKLLEILINQAPVRRLMMSQMGEEDYEGLRTAQLFRLIFEFERQGVETNYHNLSQALDDEDLARDLLPGLMFESAAPSPLSTMENNPPERAEREAAESLHSLRCMKLAEKQAALQVEINQAQRNNDTARLGELMMLKFELAKQEQALAKWAGN